MKYISAFSINWKAVLQERFTQQGSWLISSLWRTSFIKKALQISLAIEKKSVSSLPNTDTCSRPSKGVPHDEVPPHNY
jgi:hypothetical protein